MNHGSIRPQLLGCRGSTKGRSQSPGVLGCRVYVGGMPFSYEEDSIREYWSFCGPIESLEVLRFPDSGRFKGIAFITFADDEGYQNALDCNGSELDSQTLKVGRHSVYWDDAKSSLFRIIADCCWQSSGLLGFATISSRVAH